MRDEISVWLEIIDDCIVYGLGSRDMEAGGFL